MNSPLILVLMQHSLGMNLKVKTNINFMNKLPVYNNKCEIDREFGNWASIR